VYVCMHVCIMLYLCVCIYICMYVRVLCIYVCACVCILCMCICVYIRTKYSKMDKRAKYKLVRSPSENGGQDAQKDLQ